MCLIERNLPVYPLDIVRKMRDQRAMMVQTSVSGNPIVKRVAAGHTTVPGAGPGPHLCRGLRRSGDRGLRDRVTSHGHELVQQSYSKAPCIWPLLSAPPLLPPLVSRQPRGREAALADPALTAAGPPLVREEEAKLAQGSPPSHLPRDEPRGSMSISHGPTGLLKRVFVVSPELQER